MLLILTANKQRRHEWCIFTHTNNILTVTLNRTYNLMKQLCSINYNHLNVTDGAFYVGGGGVMTDTPPEGARKWFPCYDRPFDKATVDITAKVPSNVKLGSNGRLNDSTVTGDTIYYHWISVTHCNIPYCNICKSKL
jgi:aminopeptidase N